MKRELWKKELKLTRRQLAALPVAVCLCTAFCIWQNNDLTVSRYAFSSEKIGPGLDGTKIVQISDLHNKEFGENQKRLLSAVRAEEPDIIVITGDIVDGFKTKLEPALEFVRGAVSIAPVYYVSGNHESLLSTAELTELHDGMREAGAVILCNDYALIERQGETFYLLGLDDGNAGDGMLKTVMARLPDKEKLTVLLAHKPQYMDNYVLCGVNLVFSGHVHGGQIRLPWIGGLLSPEHGVFPKYDAGPYTEGGTTLIVSRGLGNSVLPLRIFDRPDVVVTTLERTQ